MDYYGTAMLLGVSSDLDAIYTVCSRVEECAAMTGNTVHPKNWLGNIVRNIEEAYCLPDILIDGVEWKGNHLVLRLQYEVYLEVYKALCALLCPYGIDAIWESGNRNGSRGNEIIFGRMTRTYPVWQLYTKQDLDAFIAKSSGQNN